MIKVKKYLDENFISTRPVIANLKSDGHYSVHGQWGYNFDLDSNTGAKNSIWCSCNNETIQINIVIDGKLDGWYGYLQTYKNLHRGKPDRHGYYARSTDEEIIKYIEYFKQKIDKYKYRRNKIERIISNVKSGSII